MGALLDCAKAQEEAPSDRAAEARAPNKGKVDALNEALLAWVRAEPTKGVHSLFDLSKSVVLRRCSKENIRELPIPETLMGYLDPSFDDTTRQDKVEFTNAGKTIAYLGKGYSTTLLKTHALRAGRHAFSVHVDLSRIRSWMQVGVVNGTRQAKGCPQVFDGTPHPFRDGELALRSDGQLLTGKTNQADGPDMNRQDRAFDTGDIVSVRIDLDKRKLEWLKNGELVKDYTFEDTDLYPSVSLDNPKEQVTLLCFFSST